MVEAMFEFSVSGTPVPQGSVRVMRGRIVAVSSRLRRWRMAVTLAAIACRQRSTETWPITGPVRAELAFTLAGKPLARPDLDKLVRAVLDAVCDAQLIVDDAQVVELSATKRRGRQPGVLVRLSALVLAA